MNAILSYIIGILHDNLVRVLIMLIFLSLLFVFFITGYDRVFVSMALWFMHHSIHIIFPYSTFQFLSMVLTLSVTFSMFYFVVGHHHAPHNKDSQSSPKK